MPTPSQKKRFIRNSDLARSGAGSPTVRSYYGFRQTKGDIGIEVEVEGNKFPKSKVPYQDEAPAGSNLIPPQWKYTKDGSLRGQDNAEYVLTKPIKFSEVDKALQDLWAMFDKFGSVLDVSNRTSVHIHLNAQEWHLNRVASFLGLYFAVEEILTEWCGDHRVGNLFCLRAKDASAIVGKMKDYIRSDHQSGITKGMHYAGCNTHALAKFGSIEFRALRGCTDIETIKTWVGILQRLYEISEDYKDPRQVCEGFSGQGPLAFLENILGPYTSEVMNDINWDNQRIMESLYDGIRNAQDICYCRNWDEFVPRKERTDPFGRNVRKAPTQNTNSFYAAAFGSGQAGPPPPSNSQTVWLDDLEMIVEHD